MFYISEYLAFYCQVRVTYIESELWVRVRRVRFRFIVHGDSSLNHQKSNSRLILSSSPESVSQSWVIQVWHAHWNTVGYLDWVIAGWHSLQMNANNDLSLYFDWTWPLTLMCFFLFNIAVILLKPMEHWDITRTARPPLSKSQMINEHSQLNMITTALSSLRRLETGSLT